MPTLDVDFDVWKALTVRRSSEEVTYNDVLRDLLDLEQVDSDPERSAGWTWKGVTLPNGTELRAVYKGREYTAKIANDAWIQGGESKSSPSQAAWSITGSGINGWTFWEVMKPGSDQWVELGSLRPKKRLVDETDV